jgi:hypothetical protein
MSLLRTFALLAVIASLATAQVVTLQTTLQGGNGQKGNMFNINNISANPVTILGFDQNFLAAGTSAMEVYTRVGSYVGSEALAANWTLVGSAAGIVHGGPGAATPVPIVVGVTIPAGATQSFYVTITNATATNVAYTNGTAVLPTPTTAGAVAFADTNIQFVCGVGKSYPFGTTFGGPTPGGAGRCWNGKINYQIGGMQGEYSINTTNCALDFDGAIGTPFIAAGVTKCIGNLVTANIAVTAALPYDIAVDFSNAIPASGGAIVLPGGQSFNLNFFTAIWLLGGAFGNFQISPGPWSIQFPAFPGTLSAQIVAVDPTSAIGISISQPSSATGSTGSAVIPGPTSDDSSVTLNLNGTYPGCALAPVPFFGTMQSSVHVISNGRLMFGGVADIDYSPTVAEALLDQPFFGIWTDFNFQAGSAVTINGTMASGLHVDYTNVIYWGTTITNTFSLHVDATTGVASIDGLTGVVPGPATAPGGTVLDQFVGISRGNDNFGTNVATDPGITAFSVSGPNPGPAGFGMIYNFGQWGTLTTGLNNLLFVPNAGGNYDWAGL